MVGAAILRCNGRRCCSSPGTRCRRGLDGREAAFELHASGGPEVWRRRLAAWFDGYNELANSVQEFVQVDLPHMDMTSLQEAQEVPRRIPQPRNVESPANEST